MNFAQNKFYKLMFIAISFFIPLVFSTLTNNVFVLNKILLLNFFLSLIYLYWFIEEIRGRRNALDFGFLILLLIFYSINLAVSTIFSVNPLLSYNYFLGFVSLFLLFYFVSSKMEEKDIELFAKSLFFSAFLVSVYSVMQFFGLDFIGWEPKEITAVRPIGTFGNPIFLSNFLAIVIPMLIFYYLKSINKITNIFYFITIILSYSVLYMTFCRGGFLAFCFSVLLLFFLKKDLIKKNGRKILALTLLIVVMPIIIYSLPVSRKTDKLVKDRISGIVSSNDLNIGARFYLWKNAINLIIDSPALGKGANTFSYTYTKYRYFEPVEMRNKFRMPGAAHNQFLEQALTGGLPLLILFVLIIYYYYKGCICCYKVYLKKDAFALLIIGGTSYLIGNIFVFNDIATDVIWFIFLGFCSAMCYKGQNEQKLRRTNKLIIMFLFLILCLFNFYYTAKIWFAEYYYNKALNESRKNNSAKTLEYLDKSISINPDNPAYFKEKGKKFESMFVSSGSYDYYKKSRDAYLRAIDLNSLDPYFWANLARLDSEALNYREAILCYLQSLYLDPYNPAFLSDTGSALYRSNHKELARGYYLRSLEIYPYSAFVSTNLAMYYIDKGDYKKADKYLKDALKYDKNYMPAEELLKNIQQNKGKHK